MSGKDIVNQDMKYICESFTDSKAFEDASIIVTGCAGFIGFYLVNFFVYLMKQGVRIKSLTLLDSFVFGRPDWLTAIAQDADNIRIHAFDIASDSIKDVEYAEQADFIIHMASIASPSYYRKYPIRTMDANVAGLKSLLEYYKELPIKALLFFSSSEIYGDPDPRFIPTSEEYKGNVSCIGPRSCYDEAKRFGETLCYYYSSVYKMPIRIVRPFNNYGPGMNLADGRIHADFARAVLNGKDISIYSDGKPSRTYCYITDAIIGYLKVLNYSHFDYFNIGSDKPEISVKVLAEIYKRIAADLFSYNGKIVFSQSEDQQYLTDNPMRRCPDITKARSLLNYSPQVGLDDGISKYLRFLNGGITV